MTFHLMSVLVLIKTDYNCKFNKGNNIQQIKTPTKDGYTCICKIQLFSQSFK